MYGLKARVYSDDPTAYGADAAAFNASAAQYAALAAPRYRGLLRAAQDGAYRSYVLEPKTTSAAANAANHRAANQLSASRCSRPRTRFSTHQHAHAHLRLAPHEPPPTPAEGRSKSQPEARGGRRDPARPCGQPGE